MNGSQGSINEVMRKFVFLAFAILGLTNIATIYSAIIKADAVYKFPLTFRNNDFEKIVRLNWYEDKT